VVSSNSGVGIDVRDVFAVGNIIERNRIGLTGGLCIANCDRGNGSHGVLIRDGANGNRVRDNLIHFNHGDGVAVVAAQDNPISNNEFRDNAGEGIDLGNDGPTVNNNDYLSPPAGGGNRNLNHPFLIQAIGGHGRGTIRGTLATRNGVYRVEYYATDEACSPVIRGQGRVPLGASEVMVSGGSPATGNGSGSLDGDIIEREGSSTYFSSAPRKILATATRMDTANGVRKLIETSEFSGCIDYTNDVIFLNGF
jgi:parallel beta-helix repeat protein